MGKDLKIIANGFGDISRAAISLNQTNAIVSEENKEIPKLDLRIL